MAKGGIGSFLMGALLGAGAIVLSDKDKRQKLMDKANELRGKGMDKVDQLKDKVDQKKREVGKQLMESGNKDEMDDSSI